MKRRMLGFAAAGLLVLATSLGWTQRRPIRAFLHACLDLGYLTGNTREPMARARVPGRVVAHAGGAVGNRVYTNALEALEGNHSRGHRMFELDFERTRDGRVVLLHDWGGTWRDLRPGSTSGGRRSHAEFMSVPMAGGLHPVDWPLLQGWLRAHPEAWVVTDVKDDNLSILRELAREQDLRPRIIPQIYGIRQFDEVSALGFPQIWLTLYRRDYPNWALERMFARHPIAALVCPPERALSGGLSATLSKRNIPVFVHTINHESEVKKLVKNGIYGVYTDFLDNKSSAIPALDLENGP